MLIKTIKRITFLIFVCSSIIGKAQVTTDCETNMNDCFAYIADDYDYGDINLEPASRSNKFTICIFTILNENSLPGITDSQIDAAIASLQNNFKATGFKFDTALFTISNSAYSTLDLDSDLMDDVSRLYNQENRINIYLVDELNTPSNPTRSYIPNVDPTLHKDYIFITKTAFTNSELLSHNLGHIFGLAHIQESGMGVEKADRSNCATTGDKVCDTSADHSWNTMSISVGSSCRFSNGQIRKMIDFAKKHRSYLR